jgi:amino acid transporter
MTKPQLKRELGLLRATMLGVGGAISAGGFATIGYAAGLAGEAIVAVVFVIGFISLITMLSYAELGTALPIAGGEYAYSKVAFGGFVSFLTGWFEWLSNMFYTALSAMGFALAIAYIFPPLNVPVAAMFVVIIFAFVNLKGVKETGTAETIITVIVLAILGVFVLGGLAYSPGAQPARPPFPVGLISIFMAASFLFDLYLGGEAVAASQAEIKNPGRNIPRAIVISGIILIILYTSVIAATVGVVPPAVLMEKVSPIAFAAEQAMGPAGGILVTIGLAIAGLAATNEAIMAQSRVLYAMGKDRYLPKILCQVHRRYCTPYISIAVCAVFTALFTATGLVNFVVYAVNLGFIIGFAIVNLSVIRLRKTAPHLDRPFKVPLYPLMPILGLATCAFLFLFIESPAIVMGLGLGIVAVLVYYVRMVGYHRIRIALGGVSVGLGVFAVFAAYLLGAKSIVLHGVDPGVSTLVFWLLIIVSIVEMLGGLLNMMAPTNRKRAAKPRD